MKKCNYLIIILLIVSVLVLLIPVLLNYVMRIKAPTPVVGGDRSSEIWLAFWGAYLAAVGSFFVAWLSYRNNKENGERAVLIEMIRIKETECQLLKEELSRNEAILSINNAIEVYILAKEDWMKADSKLNRWQMDISNILFNHVAIFDQNDPVALSYSSELKRANEFYADLAKDLKEVFIKERFKKLGGRDIGKIEAIIEKYYESSGDVNKLSSSGFQLLINKKEELTQVRTGLSR